MQKNAVPHLFKWFKIHFWKKRTRYPSNIDPDPAPRWAPGLDTAGANNCHTESNLNGAQSISELGCQPEASAAYSGSVLSSTGGPPPLRAPPLAPDPAGGST